MVARLLVEPLPQTILRDYFSHTDASHIPANIKSTTRGSWRLHNPHWLPFSVWCKNFLSFATQKGLSNILSPTPLYNKGLSIYYVIQDGGGSPRFITILQWVGGSLGTPNLYYVIYGRPLTDLLLKTRDPWWATGVANVGTWVDGSAGNLCLFLFAAPLDTFFTLSSVYKDLSKCCSGSIFK